MVPPTSEYPEADRRQGIKIAKRLKGGQIEKCNLRDGRCAARRGGSGEQVAVLGAGAGGLDGLFQDLAGFFGAVLILQDEHQVAAALDQKRVQLDGAAGAGLVLARAA